MNAPLRATLAVAVIALACAALLPAAVRGQSAPPVAPDIRNSPGYKPLVDPESMAVVLGRRPNAPKVKLPLTGGLRKLDDIGRAACWAMLHGEPDTLMKLCVNEKEFTEILWPEFPQSRPVTGLKAADGWGTLQARLVGGTRGLAQDNAGRHLEFVRWERRDTTAVYRNFRLHNGLLLVVKNEQGVEEKLDGIRSVVERGGRFKLYSLRD